MVHVFNKTIKNTLPASFLVSLQDQFAIDIEKLKQIYVSHISKNITDAIKTFWLILKTFMNKKNIHAFPRIFTKINLLEISTRKVIVLINPLQPVNFHLFLKAEHCSHCQ